MTVSNATGSRRKDQARAMLEKQWESERLEELEQENARLRAQLKLPERQRKGRLPKRSTAETWTLKRAKKLCGDGRTSAGREARAFIQDLHDNGVGGNGLRAMIGALMIQCDALFADQELEARDRIRALDTKLKAIGTLLKIREVEAMEAAEVENQITLHVEHHYPNDEDAWREAIDVTPRED